jgi:hypothetical protein
MSNWRRWVIGDAFEVHSIQLYRDLFLLWPILLFSIIFGASLTSPHNGHDWQVILRSGACTIGAIFLAKERVWLIAVVLFYIGVRLCFAALLKLNWKYGLVAAVLLGSLWILIRKNEERLSNPSYSFPKKLHLLDIVVALAGLCVALALGHYWITV